jgi:hypothetical protein
MQLQEWIHRMELGAGAKYVRWFGGVIGFVMLALIYNALCFHNLRNPEAMDAAQLGRNIARGDGFTTLFIRPISVGLTREARGDKKTLLKEGHRDISNAPVYPLVLAGLSIVTPAPGDLLAGRPFSIHWPDLYIAVLNQLLFGLGTLLVFRLALRWFNTTVAWISALLFLFTELYWRFSVSGLSTILLIDFMLLLVLMLSRFEQRAREQGSATLLHAAAIGAFVGVMMLTRYSVGWLILPVMIFIAACGSGRRWPLALAALAAFVIVVGPWVARNVVASGLPFGTATYAVVEGTPVFAGDTMPRSLVPTFSGIPGESWILFVTVLHKGIGGIREIILSDLPRSGGNWVWAFFLAGLLVRFQAANLSRARWFVVGALLLLIPVQAFSRTHLATEVPEVNSENLLVLLSPLLLIFGVGFFFVLFESWSVPSVALRLGALTGFVAVMALPLALALLPPRPARNSSPYYPPRIQQLAQYLEPRELWMTDIPWALAWYGDRQAIWLTVNPNKEFFEVSDWYKTIDGLYISMRTGDAKFVSNWFGGTERRWASLMLQVFVLREVPKGFPLRHSPEGLSTLGELLLTDRDRWSETAPK